MYEYLFHPTVYMYHVLSAGCPFSSRSCLLGRLSENNVNILKWPNQSLDLNPIGKLWRFLKIQIRKRTRANINNTGLQRNWGKHKNTRFYLIWECWIQIWNPFLLITSIFFDMHSVHFVHIHRGVYEFRVNSNIVRHMAYFLVIKH